MIQSKKISLVIPCKNEAKALRSLLPKIPSYIDQTVIVDNNSTDETTEVVKDFNVDFVSEPKHIGGVGYGFAHQAGLKKATGDYIVTLDGDDTYPVDSIRKIIAYMEQNNYSFVSCSRLPLKRTVAISFIRRLGIHILNLEIAVLYGYLFKDILTGMWIVKRELAQKLDAKSGDWNYSPEVKLSALRLDRPHFSEYHIEHFARVNGRSKLNIWKTGFGHFLYIITKRFTKDYHLTINWKMFPRLIYYSLRGLFSLFILYLLVVLRARKLQ